MKSVIALLLVTGCASNPEYLVSPINMEAGTMAAAEARSSLMLPIIEQSADENAQRLLDAMRLGLPEAEVPYVRLSSFDISVEWSVKNLEDQPGEFLVELDGANEVFAYDPTMINLFPADDEAPPTPGLAGNIPIDIAGGATVSGAFREDQLLEAAIDLDMITRGNSNPFAATLTSQKNIDMFQPLSAPMPMNPVCQMDPNDPVCQQAPVGPPIPREAIRGLIRIDMVFKPNRHMVLDYTVRVRDHRGILAKTLLSAPACPNMTDPDNCQVMFMPAFYAP